MRNPLVLLIHLYIDGCRTGGRRNGAIVGPNGPKNEVDDVKVVTVSALECDGYIAWACGSSVERAPTWTEGCHSHENLLESYSCKGV
jgi:hypothetical protein